VLKPDSDESLTQRAKDSCSSEHDLSALDPTLVVFGRRHRRGSIVFTFGKVYSGLTRTYN
jgi:hypothetical protein